MANALPRRLRFLSRFFRRRKYVSLGEQPLSPLDPTPAPPPTIPKPRSASWRSVSVNSKVRVHVPLPSRNSSRQTASRDPAPTAPVHLGHRSLRRSASERPVTREAKAAVQKFLSGPEPETEEEKQRRESIAVLRKLSASGRVPGYAY